MFDTPSRVTRRALGRTAQPADPGPSAQAPQPASEERAAVSFVFDKVTARGRAASPTKAGAII